MVTATYDVYNENEKEGSYEMEFESEEDAYRWWRSQTGHPFLYITNFKIK